MMCLFQNSRSTTLEDFKKSLYNRIKLFYILGFLGLFTLTLGILSVTTTLFTIQDYYSGFLTGFGSTLIIVSIVFILRTHKILKNEVKLKEERLKYQDERNILIANQSIKVATAVLLICLYIGIVFILFVNHHMLYFLLVPIFVFIISYFIATLYFDKHY